MDFFIQAIGFIGIALIIISVQFNVHWKIMLFRTLGSITFVIQYIFLGAWVGMVMDLIGCIRNIVFTYNVRKKRENIFWIWFFSIVTIICGVTTIIMTWDKCIGYVSHWSSDQNVVLILAVSVSIISIFAKLITTIAYGFKNPHIIRRLNIPSSVCWVVYNVLAFSIAGIVSDLMSLISTIIAEIRYTGKPSLENKSKQNNEHN